MSLFIVKAGLLDTIQDTGRYGYGSFGINPTGAMDRYAAQVANSLVGNEPDEAVIECHFPAAQVLFEMDVLISITGADFTPYLNNEALPLWKPILVRKNTVLHFQKVRNGTRCYIAVNGGFKIDKWLNSFSTNTIAHAGGCHGRKLIMEDRIFCNNELNNIEIKEDEIFLPLPWQANTENVYNSNTLFFIKGNEWDLLETSSKRLFANVYFKIDQSSDKMGYNLKSEALQLKEKTEMISSPVTFGTIQLLPNGQLIILMADHQTTGGYPRIGHIITAHLPVLAQMKPSTSIRLKDTDINTAMELLFSQQQCLLLMKTACLQNLNNYYARH